MRVNKGRGGGMRVGEGEGGGEEGGGGGGSSDIFTCTKNSKEVLWYFQPPSNISLFTLPRSKNNTAKQNKMFCSAD